MHGPSVSMEGEPAQASATCWCVAKGAQWLSQMCRPTNIIAGDTPFYDNCPQIPVPAIAGERFQATLISLSDANCSHTARIQKLFQTRHVRRKSGHTEWFVDVLVS